MENTEYDNLFGIDVSNWSGKIDFNRVAQSKVEVVYIQATEGTYYTDPYLNEFYKGAKENGLKVGFYHFFNPGNSPTPEEQARYFVNALHDKKSDCKLILDLEQTGGLNNNEVSNQAVRFLKEVQRLSGLDVAVYTYTSFAKNNLSSSSGIGDYPLWIAEYGVKRPVSNPIWGDNYAGWQYSDTGRVHGISGNTDMDTFTSLILLDEKDKEINPDKKHDDKSQSDKENTNAKNDNKQESDKEQTNKIVRYYIVQEGDTLGSIASKFRTTIQEIAKVNNISNLNLIYVGQTLKIYTSSNIGNNKKVFSRTYVIQNGDTLSSIAMKFATTVQELVELNDIQNPNLVYVGEILKLPQTNKDAHGKGASKKQHVNTYVVRKGDTLGSIAKKFNTTIELLVKLNAISNPNLIYVGQILKIYSSGVSPSTSKFSGIYVVKKGDTLGSISQKFNVGIAELTENNDIQNPNLIYPGQVIRV